MRMKRYLLLFLAFITAGILVAIPGLKADETANFGDEEQSSSSGKTSSSMTSVQSLVDRLNLHLRLDFTYEQTFDEEGIGSFSENHTVLYAMADITDKLQVDMDILFKYYWEIRYLFTPQTRLTLGKINIPFGDFNGHPIYGGQVYETASNNVIPYIFTDYGIAWRQRLFSTSFMTGTYDLYITNGFQGWQDQIDLTYLGYSKDNNNKKAIGLRWQSVFASQYRLSLSLHNDYYDDKGKARFGMGALDFAAAPGFIAVPGLDRIGIAAGYLTGQIAAVDSAANTESGFFDYSYATIADYLELKIRALNTLHFAVRYGILDPNDQIDDSNDWQTTAARIIWDATPNLQLLGEYQWHKEKFGDQVDNDYLLLKVGVVI